MKYKTIITAFALSICTGGYAQQEIKLPAPNKARGSQVTKALSDRQSDRECAARELSQKDLSDLIWAANGINRPQSGKRTAPSAMNRQDIEVYVFTAKGAYHYIATEHALKLIASGDHRKLLSGGQDFVTKFPVSLVLISDLSKFGTINDTNRMAAAIDAGIVSQNINIFCAGTGLSTVTRMTMDNNAIKKLLKLNDFHLPLLNNPVGYKNSQDNP